jgi:hypothetical protein
VSVTNYHGEAIEATSTLGLGKMMFRQRQWWSRSMHSRRRLCTESPFNSQRCHSELGHPCLPSPHLAHFPILPLIISRRVLERKPTSPLISSRPLTPPRLLIPKNAHPKPYTRYRSITQGAQDVPTLPIANVSYVAVDCA